MAKFYGSVGYGEAIQSGPGVFEDIIIEKPYFGDVVRNTRQLKTNSESTNDDISVSNLISIVADAYAMNHFFAIRYVEWAGCLWKVAEVTVKAPRLLLRLGEVYHGPTPV